MAQKGSNRHTRTSKFLSYVLRHRPERIGIVLDEAGWVDVAELLAASARRGRPIGMDELRRVAAENDKQRFAFSDDGTRIRASQGHSIPIDLGYAPTVPPVALYHGTTSRDLGAIAREGLTKRNRHAVHLSLDRQTARNVGSRHGKPVVLEVDAAAMHAAGFEFYLSDNGVWLTDHVPAKYLDLPERWTRAAAKISSEREERT